MKSAKETREFFLPRRTFSDKTILLLLLLLLFFLHENQIDQINLPIFQIS